MTIARFSNGYINKTRTVEDTVMAITKSGSTFHVKEVIFAIRSQGVKENQISDKDVSHRVAQMARLTLSPIKQANRYSWYTRTN